MSFQTIRITQDGAVAQLHLARPEKRNAMSERMLIELTQAAQDLGRDDTVRIVVLRADGDVFCAGGDLEWMRAQMAASAQERRAGALHLSDMLAVLDAIPKPLIGRVEGNAFGGGVGLIAVCDAVIALETCRFGLTETRLGLVPATIGPYVCARIGPHASRWFTSPRLFDAAEARRIGLISEIVTPDQMEAAIRDEITPRLTAAPAAVARAKALQRRLRGKISPEETEAALDALVESWSHKEADEGISAFFEKRRPPWQTD